MIEETLLEAIDKMDKAVGHVQSQFPTVRTGRAAPALVEKLTVEYYGSPVPLQQLAAIQVPEARQLLVRPHDRGSLGGDREGDPRLRPRRQPEQRRHRRSASRSRRSPRSAARSTSRSSSTWPRTAGSPCATCAATPASTSRASERDGEISADELERAEKELEKITHDHVESIDAALGRKEAELLEV